MDLHFLVTSVLGGYGGSGTVVHCDPLSKNAGCVKVTATDGFGNVAEAIIENEMWRQAIIEKLASFK